jgi:hypothetical protein
MAFIPAAIAAIPSWVGTAAAIGGTLMQAGAARSAGQASEASANFNAESAKIEAQSRENAQRVEAARNQGRIRANIGKSGVTSEGTPLMVLAESAANAEIDALNTNYTGQRQAAVYKAGGINARRAGNVQAGTSLLSGATKIF